MFAYVFSDGKWIETEKLYPHDIALILDPDDKIIYIWKGPRTASKARKEAEPYISELRKKYPKFSYLELGDVVPLRVQAEIERLMDKTFGKKIKTDRTPPFSIYLYMIAAAAFLTVISYIVVLLPVSWNPSVTHSGYSEVNEFDFALWVQFAGIACSVIIIIYAAALIDAAFTSNVLLISIAAVNALIAAGTYFYVSLGEFLFEFGTFSNMKEYTYYILTADIERFAFIVSVALIVILLLDGLAIYTILSGTRPIKLSEWRARRREAKMEEKKISILERKAEVITVEDVMGADIPHKR